MGLDITVHIEIKLEDKWRHYARTYPERDYAFFGLISEDCYKSLSDGSDSGKIKPLFKTKGLPEDATYLTRKEFEKFKDDCYYPSWLGVEELIKLREEYIKRVNFDFSKYRILINKFKTYVFGDGLIEWYEYPEENKMDIEDLRVVFWFD